MSRQGKVYRENPATGSLQCPDRGFGTASKAEAGTEMSKQPDIHNRSIQMI